jgi:hypothetical protein
VLQHPLLRHLLLPLLLLTEYLAAHLAAAAARQPHDLAQQTARCLTQHVSVQLLLQRRAQLCPARRQLLLQNQWHLCRLLLLLPGQMQRHCCLS